MYSPASLRVSKKALKLVGLIRTFVATALTSQVALSNGLFPSIDIAIVWRAGGIRNFECRIEAMLVTSIEMIAIICGKYCCSARHSRDSRHSTVSV